MPNVKVTKFIGFAVMFPLARGNTFPKFLTVMQLPSTPIGLTDQGDMGSKVTNLTYKKTVSP